MIVAATLVAGCGANDASFPVTDPRELLTKVVDRTIALQRVHVDAQLVEAGNLLGGPVGAMLQADLDIANSELSLTAKSMELAADPIRLVIADGHVFNSSGDSSGVVPLADVAAGGPLGLLPARERVVEAIRAIVADGRLGLELRDPVECSVGRCYALVVTVPMVVLWDDLGPLARPVLGLPDVLPGDVPAVSLFLVADPATFDLIYIELVSAPSTGRIRLRVDASAHDKPMQIVLPP